MNLATCSYSAWRAGYGQPIRVTLGKPRWPEPTGRAQWVYFSELAPKPWYWRSARFDTYYRRQLDRFAEDIEMKVAWLAERFGPITLLCYERRVLPGECHRLIAGEWISKRLGIEVPELDPATKSGQAARR